MVGVGVGVGVGGLVVVDLHGLVGLVVLVA